MPERMPRDFPEFLDPGECEAIASSQELNADVLLIDEWDGREEAMRRHLNVTGPLRVLAIASEKGLVDLLAAISRLRATNFRASAKLSPGPRPIVAYKLPRVELPILLNLMPVPDQAGRSTV